MSAPEDTGESAVERACYELRRVLHRKHKGAESAVEVETIATIALASCCVIERILIAHKLIDQVTFNLAQAEEIATLTAVANAQYPLIQRPN